MNLRRSNRRAPLRIVSEHVEIDLARAYRGDDDAAMWVMTVRPVTPPMTAQRVVTSDAWAKITRALRRIGLL